jgi:hypothetical protein
VAVSVAASLAGSSCHWEFRGGPEETGGFDEAIRSVFDEAVGTAVA